MDNPDQRGWDASFTNDGLKIEYRPISSLVLHRNNPRNHSEKQIRQLAASIEPFGNNESGPRRRLRNVVAEARAGTGTGWPSNSRPSPRSSSTLTARRRASRLLSSTS